MIKLRNRSVWLVLVVCLVLAPACGGSRESGVGSLDVPEDAVARVVLFSAGDCTVCDELVGEMISPLQERCGAALELKVVDVGDAEGYEAFVATETLVVGEAGRWEVPTIVVADVAFVGEAAIRDGFLAHLTCVFGAGGSDWPAGDALFGIAAQSVPTVAAGSPFAGPSDDSVVSCVDDGDSDACETDAPIFALYLSGANCTDTCERTRYDLAYLTGVYPQLIFEERSIEDNVELTAALREQLGVPGERWGEAPAVVVGEDYLTGDGLLLSNLRERIGAYTETGATAIWYLIEIP